MPIDPKKLIDEVEGGLKNSRKIRDAARKNYEYWSMQFVRITPSEFYDGRYTTDAIERYSPVLRRISDVLCGNLYKSDPRRILADKISTELLAKVYRRQRMQAQFGSGF